ncbi:MAG: hypothetical protein K2N82_00345 [Lachnospiraceae bacterium]|nr:hypothetical protein [Lachnospiraceae bacterium]
MGFSKRELIQFFDRMTELVREECQIGAKILAGMFPIKFSRRFAIVSGMGSYAPVKRAGHANKILEEIWRVDSPRREAATNGD